QFAKALDGGIGEAFGEAAGLEDGDLFVAAVGYFRTAAAAGEPVVAPPQGAHFTEAALDELRRHLARKLDLVQGDRHAWLWVTDFPMFDWDEEVDRVVAAHHPFTAPHQDDIPRLRELAEQA